MKLLTFVAIFGLLHVRANSQCALLCQSGSLTAATLEITTNCGATGAVTCDHCLFGYANVTKVSTSEFAYLNICVNSCPTSSPAISAWTGGNTFSTNAIGISPSVLPTLFALGDAASISVTGIYCV